LGNTYARARGREGVAHPAHQDVFILEAFDRPDVFKHTWSHGREFCKNFGKAVSKNALTSSGSTTPKFFLWKGWFRISKGVSSIRIPAKKAYFSRY
jgi:hypothetical protein